MELTDLEQKLANISKNYMSIKRAFLSHTISSRYHDISNPFVLFCLDVENAFNSLSSPLRRIINNEFFYQDYANWWKKYYSKKQFSVLKKIAVFKFMEAYHEI